MSPPKRTQMTGEHLCGVASLLPTFSGLNNLEINATNGFFHGENFLACSINHFWTFFTVKGRKKSRFAAHDTSPCLC
jgi:hypothetical protein